MKRLFDLGLGNFRQFRKNDTSKFKIACQRCDKNRQSCFSGFDLEQWRSIQTVKTVLEHTPPELAADLADNGIVLTGGVALLKNLDKLLSEESGLPITITENPLSTVALGAGKALDSIEILRQVMIQ